MFRKSTIFYASLFIVSLTSFSIITSCSTVYSPDIIESDGPHHFVEPLDWDPFSLQIDTEPEEHASNVFMHNALSSIDIPAPPYAIQVRVIVEELGLRCGKANLRHRCKELAEIVIAVLMS